MAGIQGCHVFPLGNLGGEYGGLFCHRLAQRIGRKEFSQFRGDLPVWIRRIPWGVHDIFRIRARDLESASAPGGRSCRCEHSREFGCWNVSGLVRTLTCRSGVDQGSFSAYERILVLIFRDHGPDFPSRHLKKVTND